MTPLALASGAASLLGGYNLARMFVRKTAEKRKQLRDAREMYKSIKQTIGLVHRLGDTLNTPEARNKKALELMGKLRTLAAEEAAEAAVQPQQ